jgi:hypothetical protein
VHIDDLEGPIRVDPHSKIAMGRDSRSRWHLLEWPAWFLWVLTILTFVVARRMKRPSSQHRRW